MGSRHPHLRRATFRPTVESLEDRLNPGAAFIPGGQVVSAAVSGLTGVLLVTPAAAQAPAHTVTINQQVSSVSLPNGDVLPGHGLKTAEAHTPVVDWTPT